MKDFLKFLLGLHIVSALFGDSEEKEGPGCLLTFIYIMIGILIFLLPSIGVIALFNLYDPGKDAVETAMNHLGWWIFSFVAWIVVVYIIQRIVD